MPAPWPAQEVKTATAPNDDRVPFVLGFVAGLLVGALTGQGRTGCIILAAVPVAMIVYVAWWQGQNPDKLRSTSGLDFLFGPLWPSLGAIAGFYVGVWVNSYLRER